MTSLRVACVADLAESLVAFDGEDALDTAPILDGFTIAFDLDGTLVDTAPDLIGVLNLLLVEEGLQPVPLASARHLVGGGVFVMLRHGFAEAGQPLDPEHAKALFDRYLVLYEGRIAADSRPFPGVQDALFQLQLWGARLAVCTNKLTGLSIQLLLALDLAGHFGAIVGPDEAPARKPDPTHLWAAVDGVGGDHERVIYVGDSETDLLTARAAGVPAIGVSFGYTEVPARDLGFDVVIDHYRQLPGVVERMACELGIAIADRR